MMKAIVYDAPRKFSYRDVETPKINADEILLRVHACGLCGTDLHVHEGDFGPRFPLTPGHEFSGEMVELGSEVTGLKKGSAPPRRRLSRAANAFTVSAAMISCVKTSVASE
jgi:D-arabinitol dehydrogenase (NADP+)